MKTIKVSVTPKTGYMMRYEIAGNVFGYREDGDTILRTSPTDVGDKNVSTIRETDKMWEYTKFLFIDRFMGALEENYTPEFRNKLREALEYLGIDVNSRTTIDA